MLIYQNQDCELTLKEGIKIYENYLIEKLPKYLQDNINKYQEWID